MLRFLMVNVTVTWNTIYVYPAPNQLRAQGLDVAHLLMLGFEHINTLGCYAVVLPDLIAGSKLRPFHDPAAVIYYEG